MEGKTFYVYILTNIINTVLYVGITNNLERRLEEHKNGINEGFTKQYNLKKLVYYEVFLDPRDAINREKQIKNWHRQWKINLVKGLNPTLKDLSDEWE
ncbi:GIY-YIG nuclease family protein [Patescibacteria group bacterium]|nr:MAG: GIY-YIG nuclease family protein [Patescibacteria group bacterium]